MLCIIIRNYQMFLLAVYCMYIMTAIVLQLTVLHSFRLPSFFWNGFLKLYTCKTSGGLISQQHAQHSMLQYIQYSTPLFFPRPAANTPIRFFSCQALPHKKWKSASDLPYVHIASMHVSLSLQGLLFSITSFERCMHACTIVSMSVVIIIYY